MWLFNRHGFFSVVQYRGESNLLIVRARFEGDLEKVKKIMGWKVKIQKTPEADYCFRIEVPREWWVDYLMYSARTIDYDNFKGSLEDNERHNIYLRVWGVLRNAADSALGVVRFKRGRKKKGKNSYLFDQSGVYSGKDDFDGLRYSRFGDETF